MRRLLCLTLATALLAAAPAGAACYVDYKAKQENPLRLHYGVAELSAATCDRGKAKQALAQRLKAAGWQLLTVVSVFDDSGLEERKGAAGDYFLRF